MNDITALMPSADPQVMRYLMVVVPQDAPPVMLDFPSCEAMLEEVNRHIASGSLAELYPFFGHPIELRTVPAYLMARDGQRMIAQDLPDSVSYLPPMGTITTSHSLPPPGPTINGKLLVATYVSSQPAKE
jgi:hypothetical protein